MRKKIIICLSSIILVLIVIFAVYTKVNTKKPFDNTTSIHETIELQNFNYPDFTLDIGGIIQKKLTKEDLINANIKVYQFDANTLTSYRMEKDKYIGVKLFDVLDSLNAEKYTKLYFAGPFTDTITFKVEELEKDSSYLIFYRDGEKIMNYDVSLINFNLLYNYSVEGLREIDLYN